MMPDLHTVNIYSTNLVNIKLKVNLIQIQIFDIIHHGLLIWSDIQRKCDSVNEINNVGKVELLTVTKVNTQ